MQSSDTKNPQDSGTVDEVRLAPFRYFPDQSLLLREGKRVRVGSRALSLLKVLPANAGQFVPNEVLIAAAWPNTSVDETNLRVQMTALRQLLSVDGDLLKITNAPGRGYALIVVPGGPRADDAPASLPTLTRGLWTTQ
jgi:DNA-binding winged helix-turn-helix (wHTH) protein